MPPVSQANQLLQRWVKQFHKILQSHGWPTESPQSPPALPAPLHLHSDSPPSLTPSTTNQSGRCSRRQCPGTPHSWPTRSNDLVLTTILAGGCSIFVSMFCIFMDRWLCGVSVHIVTSTPHQFHTLPHLGSDCGTYPPLTLTLTTESSQSPPRLPAPHPLHSG